MSQSIEIGIRRINYACCALDYLSKYLNRSKYGDKDCGKYRRLWLYMLWAKSVADRTPQDENDSGCLTYEFAKQVFKKADCYCSSCGCPDDGEGSTYPPPPGFCDPTVTYNVIDAVDTGDQATIEAGPPAIGDSYFVVTSNAPGITWAVNQVVTWNGTGWDTDINGYYQIVQTSAGVYWTTLDGVTPGLLYPPITMTFTGPGFYDIQTTAPQISQYTGRTVIIQLLTTGGWQNALQLPEADITTPYAFDASGFSFTSVSAFYIYGDCSWQAPIGTIIPTNCIFPRDHDCNDHDTQDHS